MHAGCVFESCVIVLVFQTKCAYWRVDDCVVFAVSRNFKRTSLLRSFLLAALVRLWVDPILEDIAVVEKLVNVQL